MPAPCYHQQGRVSKLIAPSRTILTTMPGGTCAPQVHVSAGSSGADTLFTHGCLGPGINGRIFMVCALNAGLLAQPVSSDLALSWTGLKVVLVDSSISKALLITKYCWWISK